MGYDGQAVTAESGPDGMSQQYRHLKASLVTTEIGRVFNMKTHKTLETKTKVD